MAGEINFGILNAQAPAQAANSLYEGQQQAQANALAKMQMMHAQTANDLQKYQLSQAQRSDQVQNQMLEDLRTAGSDREAVKNALIRAGKPGEAYKLDLDQSTVTKNNAEAGKFNADTHTKFLTANKDFAARVFANPTPESANAAINASEALAKSLGINIDGDIAAQRQQIAAFTSPDQIKQWAAGHALQVDKLLPAIQTRNTGGSTDTLAVDPITGKPTVTGSVRNTQSPDSIASVAATIRGQNLTDAREKAQPKGQIIQTDNGTMLVDPRSGAAKAVTDSAGNPISGVTKTLTEGQSKALLFGSRMREADKILGQLASEGTNTSVPGSSAPIIGGAINALSSDNRQMLNQAKTDFMTAVLRRESGAAISSGEYSTADKQYFPQVGDSPKTIAQKAKNRELAINGVLQEVPEKQREALSPAKTKKPSIAGGLPSGWSVEVH